MTFGEEDGMFRVYLSVLLEVIGEGKRHRHLPNGLPLTLPPPPSPGRTESVRSRANDRGAVYDRRQSHLEGLCCLL
jgi:hypothetical protein